MNCGCLNFNEGNWECKWKPWKPNWKCTWKPNWNCTWKPKCEWNWKCTWKPKCKWKPKCEWIWKLKYKPNWKKCCSKSHWKEFCSRSHWKEVCSKPNWKDFCNRQKCKGLCSTQKCKGLCSKSKWKELWKKPNWKELCKPSNYKPNFKFDYKPKCCCDWRRIYTHCCCCIDLELGCYIIAIVNSMICGMGLCTGKFHPANWFLLFARLGYLLDLLGCASLIVGITFNHCIYILIYLMNHVLCIVFAIIYNYLWISRCILCVYTTIISSAGIVINIYFWFPVLRYYRECRWKKSPDYDLKILPPKTTFKQRCRNLKMRIQERKRKNEIYPDNTDKERENNMTESTDVV